MRNYETLLKWLEEEYSRQFPLSAGLNENAKKVMIDGGNHTLRLIKPFPPRIKSAHGAQIFDVDGHTITDFWQGHFANILGHNPDAVTTGLADAFASGWGLQTGFAEEVQIDAADLLCRLTNNESVRFTTSGSLATLYAVMLARSFTGRSRVLKISGGWHGGQPWGLKGVKFKKGVGYDHVEGEGLPPEFGSDILLTRFNDPERLNDIFQQHGGNIACFIVEPVIGGGGFIPATRDYLQTARELCDRYGAVLIFDEIITGFRFRAGDVGSLYGVKADLSTFGKVMGGGMPVAAVAGKKEILEMSGRGTGQRVWFSGGTYSGHPASMLAAKLMMTHLRDNEREIYPRIALLGKKIRELCEEAFRAEGINAICTGANADLPDSSIFFLNFPHKDGQTITCPEEANNPDLCDQALRTTILPLGLLLQNVNLAEGHGAVSIAHTEHNVTQAGEACRWVARQIAEKVR
jgi:glutamate-1-semialdehyde 2,1-aminomutase